MAVDMDDLREALKAARLELEGGRSMEQAVDFAAREYELNPALIRRKLEESGITAETATAFSAGAETAADRLAADFEKARQGLARKYGQPMTAFFNATFKGRKFSVLGYTSDRYAVAVAYDDARVYRVPARGLVRR